MEQVIAIDLAKRVFQIYIPGNDEKAAINKVVTRTKLLTFIAQQPQSTIVMEACGSANYWCHQFQQLGHQVKQISPQYVAPFRMGNKNDKNDAVAIARANSQPNMRYVPVKTLEQQDIQCLHRSRQRLIKQRTALINQIRGLAAEYGVIFPEGRWNVLSQLPDYLEDAENGLTVIFRELLSVLYEELQEVDKRVKRFSRWVEQLNTSNTGVQQLLSIPGIGPLGGSVLASELGDGKCFKNGRHFASYLGLVPKEHSSGGKARLLGISKRGDAYLRGLLIHGARSVVYRVNSMPIEQCNAVQRWLKGVINRSGIHKAIVAQANKNARMAWALISHNTQYQVSA